ncbi:MAG: metal-dependent transcriptional regulator [Frankiales bacterium]|jgi:DtxR family Mn-dependent transcriptional regulator|nr:metal-dependent transcriptional regulator [Frankiales bacterium]
MQQDRHAGAHAHGPGSGHHPAVEQYLETILELEESGIPPMRARLVERLGVSAPAVSETVKRLEREGYLTLDNERLLRLTADGREYATAVLRRHRLAELLLVEVLKVPWSQVHEEACRLEHAISDNLEQHLVKLLGDPGACPHGNPIPGSANVVDPGPLQALASVPIGVPCVIRRIDEHLQTQIGHMVELEQGRVLPGQRVTIEAGKDDDRVLLDVDGVSVALERVVATEVYVSV